MKLTKEEIIICIRALQTLDSDYNWDKNIEADYLVYINISSSIFKLQHQLKHLKDKENKNV